MGARDPHKTGSGFTLIELMVALAIAVILLGIALPSFVSQIKHGRSKSATADLISLSLVLENLFQKTLSYPTYTNASIAALPSARTGTVATDFSSWSPGQGANFAYTITSTATSYTVTATGTGSLQCTLSLSDGNVRTASGVDCGFTSW